MGFSSVAAWVAACQETQLPMWEVILRQDLDQDTPEARAASLKQMEHMWEVMKIPHYNINRNSVLTVDWLAEMVHVMRKHGHPGF